MTSNIISLLWAELKNLALKRQLSTFRLTIFLKISSKLKKQFLEPFLPCIIIAFCCPPSTRRSFTMLADKVQRGLRVFNKVFTERAEFLWHSIIMLHSIADNISTVHQKAKKVGIGGGTTSAVGGVAAIAGLALAPLTFGASLIITAVGVGVATAGGITSASAAISDNVNNMHDRKKVNQFFCCLTFMN